MRENVGTYKLVHVSPDNSMSKEPKEGSEKRTTYLCPKCRIWMVPHFNEPLASCKCGTAEWGM